MAASSLTEAFQELAADWEATPAGADYNIELVLAGSSRLATQLSEGADADVVATADTASMQLIYEAGVVDKAPQVFATNTLVVVTNPDSPRVTALADLNNPGLLVAACAPQVPCGALTQGLFDANDLDVQPVTLEPNVKSVLAKVVLGEVDAGLVYTTDALAAGNDVVTFVPAGAATNVNTYPIATLSTSNGSSLTRSAASDSFVEYVLTDGQAVLERLGFGRPE